MAELAYTISGAMDKFVRAGLVIGEDAPGSEGAILDCSINDVHAGLGEGTLSGVINAKGNR